MKVVMLENSTFQFNLFTRHITFLNIFNVDVVIAGDDEGVLKFSGVQILKVVVKHVRPAEAGITTEYKPINK